jgi:hypothetical protein
LFVADGRITNYMVPEAGVVNANGSTRVVVSVLSANMATLNPQGALHTLYNYDCEPAKGVAGFSSEDMGITVIPNSLFAVPDEIVAEQLGLGVSNDQVEAIRKTIMANKFGIQECQKKCNITSA